MPVTIEYQGHSTFIVSDGSHTVLVDPFLSGNPKATKQPGEIECDSIVVTHGHADHFADTEAVARANGATVYAPYEAATYLGERGIEHLEPMAPGGKVDAPFGSVALTYAQHSSSFNGVYTGVCCGCVLKIGGRTIYNTGDTALFSDMKLMGELYKPDLCILPIGDRFTMGPEHATIAAEWIGAKIAIPCHYATWPLLRPDASGFAPRGVEVRALKPGETTEI